MLVQELKHIKTKKCSDCGKVDTEEAFATASWKKLKTTGEKKDTQETIATNVIMLK